MSSPISDSLRVDYSGVPLLESQVDPDPIVQFKRWLDDAMANDVPQANAMALATADERARPSVRIVLLKDFDANGFVFHTNYTGRKAHDLEVNQYAALVFFWEKVSRQVRIEGSVQKTTREESARYFSTRPRGAQIGAWASEQSSPIESREMLYAREAESAKSFGNDPIPLPDFWGGYRVKPSMIEFWQGQPSRLHDRLVYTRATNGSWTITRLAP
ncbi:MAG TPA: pyridoxamine 5'-phosphate oxidase [Tepidisphaeraceae bacterium]|nr:pyridoxamine 5'-phosphate oxidase [Tepidisphaeraceae bacterium]